MTVADDVLQLLRDEGVDRVFGNPGTTELPLLDALADADDLEYVLGAHEGAVVAMADGYARATRRTAFVNLHVAAGVANGLIGILNARRSRTPMVVTAGQQDSRHLIQDPMLSGDLVGLAAAAAKSATEVHRADDVLTVLRRAFRAAQAPPAGPVFVSIPMDLLDDESDFPFPARTVVQWERPADNIADAARLLRSAHRPAIVAGDGVGRADALAAVVEIAERLGAAVYHQPMFDRVDFPLDHRQYLGMLPPDNAEIRRRLEGHDVVFLVGVRAFAPHHFSSTLAIPTDAAVVQLDDDWAELGRNYPVRVAMVGSVGVSLRELAKQLDDAAPGVDTLEAVVALAASRAARTLTAQPSSGQRTPLDPRIAAQTLARALDPAAIVVEEAITTGLHLRDALRLTASDSFHHTVGGGLGWGIGAAAGVAMGSPGRRVIAAVGDGCALFGAHGLWSLARHQLPVTVVVFANGEYRTLKQTLTKLKAPAGSRGKFVGLDLNEPAIDWRRLAGGFGVDALRVSSSDELSSAIRDTGPSDAPLLIEVPIQPFEQSNLADGL